ncbi:MAG: type II toxin-antitoxin system RelE/ParE family toxin [Nitrospinae bacterium]|nr:type II toxin-antitoxin system RelE/ParE family toxin [Nitrospinota bacterium]
MPAFRPDIPPHVAEVIRHFPPDLKQSIKSAIRALSANPNGGEPLVRELEGFWKFRVKRFRIVYTIDRRRKMIRIIAVGHRHRIYDQIAEFTTHR